MEEPKDYRANQFKRRTSLKFQPRLKEAIDDCISRYKGLKILDIGFGSQENFDLWREVDAWGLDINPDVAKGEKQIIGDAHHIPLQDESFDVIFSSHTFEHGYNPEQMAKEFERIAKKAIYLIVPLEKESEDPAHYVSISNTEELINLFSWKCVEFNQRTHGDYYFLFEK